MGSLAKVLSRLSYKHVDELPYVIQTIEQKYCLLICMRGAPGSGKSHLARAIVDVTQNGDHANHIFSTDQHFVDAHTNEYRYDRSRLGTAHTWNQSRVTRRMEQGWSPIIVDNTNMTFNDMASYLRSAVRHKYLIRFLAPNTPWRTATEQLAQRNSHSVGPETIANMLQRYQAGTVSDALRAIGCFGYGRYSPQPRHRSWPREARSEPNAGSWGNGEGTQGVLLERGQGNEMKSDGMGADGRARVEEKEENEP